MPANTVKVDRSTKWGNPWRISKAMTAADCVAAFERDALSKAGQGFCRQVRKELRDKNLACWCPLDQPCHADILLRIARSRS